MPAVGHAWLAPAQRVWGSARRAALSQLLAVAGVVAAPLISKRCEDATQLVVPRVSVAFSLLSFSLGTGASGHIALPSEELDGERKCLGRSAGHRERRTNR